MLSYSQKIFLKIDISLYVTVQWSVKIWIIFNKNKNMELTLKEKSINDP